jgi:hypothetical protein
MGRGFTPNEMSPEIAIRASDTGQRYEALLRISEALSACREPEDLTRILSEQLRDFLDFFQVYIIVFKENSTDVEWAVVGSERSLISAYADVPVHERPSWQAYATQEPFQIGMQMKGFRRVSSKGLQLEALKSARWSLCPLQHRIGAWARWACPDPLEPPTRAKTLAS